MALTVPIFPCLHQMTPMNQWPKTTIMMLAARTKSTNRSRVAGVAATARSSSLMLSSFKGQGPRDAPRGPWGFLCSGTQKSMSPPMPPPPGIGIFSFSGFSATTASVVRNSAAIDAAF